VGLDGVPSSLARLAVLAKLIMGSGLVGLDGVPSSLSGLAVLAKLIMGTGLVGLDGVLAGLVGLGIVVMRTTVKDLECVPSSLAGLVVLVVPNIENRSSGSTGRAITYGISRMSSFWNRSKWFWRVCSQV
jgi:hypothetical protein